MASAEAHFPLGGPQTAYAAAADWLAFDATDADVHGLFECGEAARIFGALGAAAAVGETGAQARHLDVARALAGFPSGLEALCGKPALVAALAPPLDCPNTAVRAQALELLAVVAVSSAIGHVAVLAALDRRPGVRDRLVASLRSGPPGEARDVMLFLNTLVNAAPDVERRCSVRASLSRAGVCNAIATLRASYGDDDTALELGDQLRVFETVAADDIARAAACVGGAGDAAVRRLDDARGLLTAFEKRAGEAGAGGAVLSLAQSLSLIPLEDPAGRVALSALACDARRRALGPGDDSDVAFNDFRSGITWRHALDDRAARLGDALNALDCARARTAAADAARADLQQRFTSVQAPAMSVADPALAKYRKMLA
eukprot:CAMPEP_0119263516 /NCGR_PEP_ID=MMETSP1329-20130426/2897_1 /TAXON_ID=114041 /ORGANISM="Genus nov. species nov., Strain RCC1024" /LENGTH=372 /DNA_ID=CAMNT_0007263225 /DNA_START=86 /DNA_END=1201 /DNA_ORIENTATION=+